jgi:hypothetical protein
MSALPIYTGFDPEQFRYALASCVSYCRRYAPTQEEIDRADYEFLESETEYPLYRTLRSDALSSFAKRLFPDRSGSPYRHDTQQAMTDLISSRSQNVEGKIGVDFNREIHEPDCLLLFRWAHSLFDGAGTPASLGYVDDEYFSPWDTWLAVIPGVEWGEDCLVAWVPPWARPLVQNAMWASPTECLSWGAWELQGIRRRPRQPLP